ncbi:L-amino acid N-acyltransferase YncA [Streptomyces glaucescens]
MVEHSVYVHPAHSVHVHAAHGRGVAGALLKALIGSTEGSGNLDLQSGIFPESTSSLALHKRAASGASAPDNASATTASGATLSSSSAAVL